MRFRRETGRCTRSLTVHRRCGGMRNMGVYTKRMPASRIRASSVGATGIGGRPKKCSVLLCGFAMRVRPTSTEEQQKAEEPCRDVVQGLTLICLQLRFCQVKDYCPLEGGNAQLLGFSRSPD